jgi:predicted N-acetyltransferase YhbS
MISTEIKLKNILNQKEKDRVLEIFKDAFIDNIHTSNTNHGFFSGYKNSYPNFVLLYHGNDLIGAAVAALRNVNLLNGSVKSITVGPIAIDPPFQRKGYSNYLMQGLNMLAQKLNATIIYLIGRNSFYSRHDYYPCLARSKVVVEIDDIDEHDNVIIQPYNKKYLDEMKSMYEKLASQNTFTSCRNDNDWNWLTKYGINTYYFYKPQLIISGNKLIGYFTKDPREKTRIREAIYDTGEKNIRRFLYGMKKYSIDNNLVKFEIMTPIDSPLYRYLKKFKNTKFIQFIPDNVGQLMKILNVSKLFEELKNYFYRKNSLIKYEYSFSLFIDDERISFSKNNGKFKMSNDVYDDAVLIPKEYFPGFITGYYYDKIFRNLNFNNIQNKLAMELFFEKSVPFVYQGDNY